MWKSRSVSTTAGRTPDCSRPLVGLRSTHTRSLAPGTDKPSAVTVIDDFRPYVRTPIHERGPILRAKPFHLGHKLLQRVHWDAVHDRPLGLDLEGRLVGVELDHLPVLQPKVADDLGREAKRQAIAPACEL